MCIRDRAYPEHWLSVCLKVLDTIIALQREDGNYGYTYSPVSYTHLDVYKRQTYTYRLGILEGQYSYTTAAGLFTAIIGFGFTYAANKISNKLTGYGLW